MRDDIKIGATFPDYELPDHTDTPRKLSFLQGNDPMVVTLNRSVAVAMVHGPDAGLALLATLDADDRMTGNHRVLAVRAHLFEMAGDDDAARTAFRDAARRTTSLPEQRYLEARAARLAVAPGTEGGQHPAVR